MEVLSDAHLLCSAQTQIYMKSKSDEILHHNNNISRLKKELEDNQRESYNLEAKKDSIVQAAAERTREMGQVRPWWLCSPGHDCRLCNRAHACPCGFVSVTLGYLTASGLPQVRRSSGGMHGACACLVHCMSLLTAWQWHQPSLPCRWRDPSNSVTSQPCSAYVR